MTDSYFYGGLVSLLCGFTAVFFSQGGIVRHKDFVEFIKSKNKRNITGIITVLIMFVIGIYGMWFYGFSRGFIRFMLLATYLLAMTITDIRSRQIPDDATIFFSILFLIFHISSLNTLIILNSFIGVVIGVSLPFLAYLIKKEYIGLGDVKLIACVGLIAGFPEIINIIARGLILSALFSIVMLATKKVTIKTQLPLAPFILIGAII